MREESAEERRRVEESVLAGCPWGPHG